MSLFDTIKSIFLPLPPPAQTPTRTPGRPPRQAARARVSWDDANGMPAFGGLHVAAPADHESQWRTETLDSLTLSRRSPAELIELLADLSPEVSRALWDFARMFNPGWECRALRPSGIVDKRGQAALDAFWEMIEQQYTSADVVLNSLIVAGFLRGAFAAEIVLDQAGRLPVDLATPDPYAFRYRKVNDPARGVIWQVGQWQGSKWIPLNIPTFGYVPIDRFPGSPYGRSPVAPALFASIFLLGMLHDLRRVVQQQGYPRLDLAVSMEALREMMPGGLEDTAFKEWVDATINEVSSVYESLEPDDAYIHTDAVTVNRPVGVVDSSSLGAVDGLISGLERMITRALKTMPLLMGLSDNAGETFANRQWELHAAGIKALQHLLEELLERLLTVMLQAQGVQVHVEFRFAELRASEMLRDAQTEAMQIQNATAQYEAGWISQDEAALKGAGKEKADQPAPRTGGGGQQPAIVQSDGDGLPVADDESRILWTAEERAEKMRELWETIETLRARMAGKVNGHNGH